MIQKDYILRLTEELAKVLAQLIGKNTDAALEMLDEAYQHYLKMDRAFLDSLPPDEFLHILTQKHQLHVNHLELLAELLAEEGRLLYKGERLVESKNQIQKALLIFEYLDDHQGLYSFERVLKIGELHKILAKIN